MSSGLTPNRFTFRPQGQEEDRDRLGEAKDAFNRDPNERDPNERERSQSGSDDKVAGDRTEQRETVEGFAPPKLTPNGSTIGKRFSYRDAAQEQSVEPDQDIDLESGEWVIEFVPENIEPDQNRGDR